MNFNYYHWYGNGGGSLSFFRHLVIYFYFQHPREDMKNTIDEAIFFSVLYNIPQLRNLVINLTATKVIFRRLWGVEYN